MRGTHPTAASDRPAIDSADAVSIAAELYGVTGDVAELPSEHDLVFRIVPPTGPGWVLKVSRAGEDPALLEAQEAAANRLHAAGTPFRFPRSLPSRSGATIERLGGSDGRFVRLVEYIPGEPLATSRPHTAGLLAGVGALTGTVDRVLDGFDHPALDRGHSWDTRAGPDLVRAFRAFTPPDRRALLVRLVERAEAALAPIRAGLRVGVIHGDANDWNVLVSKPDADGEREVIGLLDFGDLMRSWLVAEPAIAMAYAMLDEHDPLAAAAAVLRGYRAEFPLGDAELDAVLPLAIIRLATSVSISARRRAEHAENEYLFVSERAAWDLLERIDRLDMDTAADTLGSLSAPALNPRPRPSPTPSLPIPSILKARKRLIGPSLSLAYQHPLHIVRGEGTYLFDDAGRAYLDCVNNVAHVGHSHPRVVDVLARQAAVLNTNTRYLHENLTRYAERLTALMPEPLRVCYFVNSGSEANELALRLARAHTGRRDVVVLEHAYHGNTTSLIDISPYKFAGPGGAGRPDWTHVAPIPDPYRGRHRGYDEETGRRYVVGVREAAERAATRGVVAAFFAESLASCAGQVEYPSRFLAEAFAAARAAGGVCVADEVQVGLGRVGSHFWGFETQDAVPDIVTLGKPIGNGHPLGAVVTTPEIAASFASGMEYFNTFGGNPVSCAVGLAVLDVIEEEGLQERAHGVGARLLDGLRALADRHALIGDVRGRGLFLGVELVLDRGTLEPATAAAADVIERARGAGVLLSTDGPFHNVLKIKPPLAFGDADAAHLIEVLDEVLDSTRSARKNAEHAD